MTGRLTESGVLTPWLTTSQAQEYLQVSRTTLMQLVKVGTIPSVKRGRLLFLHADDLDAWMRSHPSGATSLLTQC